MKNILSNLAFIMAVLVLFAGWTDAKSVEFTREYTYQASEADSKLTSRAIAMEQIKRLLLEELGTFLTSRTEVRDAQLTKDEIVSYTAGTVTTIIITEKWDGSAYYMKAQIKADPDQVTEAIAAIKKNDDDSDELKRLRAKSDDSLKEIERLKKELAELKKNSSGDASAQIAQVQKKYEQTVAGLSAKEIIHQGISLMREKQYSQAVVQFNKAIAADSKSITPYVLRGNAFMAMKEPGKVVNSINEALMVMPKEPVFYFFRGRTYFMMKQYDKAMDDLNAALSLQPDYINALIAKARVYSQQNNFPQAVAELQKALQFHKQDYSVFCELGMVYQRGKRNEDAVKAFTSAIGLKPELSAAYMFRSSTYQRMNLTDKALEDLEKAAGLGNKAAQNRIDSIKKSKASNPGRVMNENLSKE
jgi:tetratricopeptide (TPR) repeat protein